MANFAVCVTLYNPTFEQFNNILSYANHFKKIYLLNNSTKDIDLDCFTKQLLCLYEVIDFFGNSGIGKPMNICCLKAIEDGFDFLLTMDQDSCFDKEDFVDIFNTISAFDNNKAALIGLRYDGGPDIDTSPRAIITSGSFINLKLYKNVRGFDGDLFIDLVDHDFCYQLREKGYQILLIDFYFIHNMGYGIKHLSFFGRKWHCQVYPPFRYYYIVRNHIVLKKRFPSLFFPFIGFSTFVVVMFKLNNKFQYLKAFFCGYIDGKINKLGKYRPHDRLDRKMMKKYEKNI